MERITRKITGEVVLSENLPKVENIGDFKKLLLKETFQDASTLLGFLLNSAILFDTSDVHLEPLEQGTNIRFRLDGVLQDGGTLPREVFSLLLSRIKLASGIRLNVEDRPQDGRFSILAKDEAPIEVRTSTLPSQYGESLVLRILNPKNLLSLKDLGLRKDLLSLFEKELQKPNGMITVTGPTGSGKTTTLYAFLKEVASEEEKTITIEDPIEYHLEGISQTQVNPAKGYDFASGLRAIVRQDPDVILVGEIRDGETAEIALQAALTGHLVFSTLHTNDAAGTVPRLVALGAKISPIASALTLIVAQRLVRKVCKKCAFRVKPTAEEFKKIEQGLGVLKTRLKLTVGALLKISKTKGCNDCNSTGFKGRVGIFEALVVSDDTEEFILRSPSVSALKEFAIKKGMTTMYQDGLIKVTEGITTLEELARVTSE
ncbi:MAG: hypothetical protein Greene071421_350 [Parcubacteria group bacterium Greene0714_21]|nr:MAG: hypothetical protein Greene041639_3 [Parcubacteria group bacterium Greene0416_39]TSC98334.1 MAG: hypothetical protein Greene101447_77 [Parcubacteria group bacterium Greene1014_47]TSD03984.1 MAG: hypothetical protein Greene071421_350 [Parcubacteria group bacterium Greene0714_21]